MKSISLYLALILMISCDQKNKISVDTIITDATIYSLKQLFSGVFGNSCDKGKIVAINIS
jgi:hypothetical protein